MDWAYRAFWDMLLTFEKRQFPFLKRMEEAQKQQATVVARSMEATGDNHWVLDTILDLVAPKALRYLLQVNTKPAVHLTQDKELLTGFVCGTFYYKSFSWA
ncbi:hypothetical protein Y1Q_0006553 [Alligator mississippiensis]|uniref:Uncharacterized protein n=1 Tax=Alligator mississippiensis TaxID=8496 RepID=A0A151NT25_ALLMI|nr:hypothetical protein Y1Q_0006553 [Alligator mississippiensis]